MSLAYQDDTRAPALGTGARGPLEHSRVRRPPAWSQVLVVGGLCWLYDVVNNLSPVREQLALAHAAAVLHWERSWHMNPELVLNLWAGAHRWVGLALSNYYDISHFVVTLGLVGWLWWRHPDVYRPLRNALVLTNVIGFVVFWCYPLAPPRMLTDVGFTDVVAVSHAIGSWHSGTLGSQANEFAAMPSLHIAWAVWSGLAVWQVTGRRLLRISAVAYPLLTGVAVLATANHFLVDVVAGVATAAAAGGLALAAARFRPRRRLPAADVAAEEWPPARPNHVARRSAVSAVHAVDRRWPVR